MSAVSPNCVFTVIVVSNDMETEHFDIAHYAGHKALEELGKCFRLYTLPISQVLYENNIQIHSFDFKPRSDIEGLAAKVTIQDLDIGEIDYINAFHLGSRLRALNKKEIEYCINSSVFFQVMMEADINDILGSDEGSFRKKWEGFLESNIASAEDFDDFKAYFDNIYKGIRNPTVHPKEIVGLGNAEMFQFSHVHEYIKRGWSSSVFLFNKKHGSDMDKQENWKKMCGLHGVPDKIRKEDFPDIGKLAGSLYKKHTEGIDEIGR